MSPEQEAAERGIREVAQALGKEVPPGIVTALAHVFVGLVAVATGSALKRAQQAGNDAAAAIRTDADAAKELAR